MDFSVNFGEKVLVHPVGLGPGTCKTISDVRHAATSQASFIVVGAITYNTRPQNEGNVYYAHYNRTNGSLLLTQNSLGMPNGGYSVLERDVPEMVRIANDAGKLLFVNVAEFSPQGDAIMVEKAIQGGADGIEVNGGCPNIWIEGVQKPIVSYNPESVEETLVKIEERVGTPPIPIWFKISPFVTDPLLIPIGHIVTDKTPNYGFDTLTRVGNIIAASKVCSGVSAVNTLGNTLFLDENGKPAITYLDGFAGLGGPALKPIALENIRRLYNVIRPEQFIIGAGGIMTWTDVEDFLAAGADAVYLTSGYCELGNRIFKKILLGAVV